LVAIAFLLAWPAAGPAQSPAAPLPSDLDLVPRDAAAFFHFRVRDMWQSDWMKDLRYLLDKAGPAAWKDFEKRSPIVLSTIDRITLVMLSKEVFNNPFPPIDPEAMSALLVVRTTQPYDRLRLLEAAGVREKAYRRNLYYFHEDLWSGLVLVDDKTFIIGSEDAVVRWFDMAKKPNPAGPLQPALTTAAEKHHVVAGWNPTLLAKDAPVLPPALQTLMEAHCGTVTLDLDKEIRVDVRLDYLKPEQAQAGEKAARDALDLARQALGQPIAEVEKRLKDQPDKIDNLFESFAMLLGLGVLREMETQLKDATLERRGTSVAMPIRYRKFESSNMYLVALAGIQVIGRNASRTFAQVGSAIGGKKDPMQVHLETLGQAFDKYQADKGTYPTAMLSDKDGRPVLSWRVALLPYLSDEGKTLYSQFKLDEPWDSLHNKKLIKKMPQAFRSPNRYGWTAASQWKTHDQVFTGAGTLFDGAKGTTKADAGKSILLVHTGNNQSVYWTKPADLPFKAEGPLPKLAEPWENQFQALLADGTYKTLQMQMDEKELKAMIARPKK
jgi:hypothetical protein